MLACATDYPVEELVSVLSLREGFRVDEKNRLRTVVSEDIPCGRLQFEVSPAQPFDRAYFDSSQILSVLRYAPISSKNSGYMSPPDFFDPPIFLRISPQEIGEEIRRIAYVLQECNVNVYVEKQED